MAQEANADPIGSLFDKIGQVAGKFVDNFSSQASVDAITKAVLGKDAPPSVTERSRQLEDNALKQNQIMTYALIGVGVIGLIVALVLVLRK